MTEEEAKQYVGKYCDIRWPHGRMLGVITEVRGGWIAVDWGMKADLASVVSITVVHMYEGDEEWIIRD